MVICCGLLFVVEGAARCLRCFSGEAFLMRFLKLCDAGTINRAAIATSLVDKLLRSNQVVGSTS